MKFQHVIIAVCKTVQYFPIEKQCVSLFNYTECFHCTEHVKHIVFSFSCTKTANICNSLHHNIVFSKINLIYLLDLYKLKIHKKNFWLTCKGDFCITIYALFLDTVLVWFGASPGPLHVTEVLTPPLPPGIFLQPLLLCPSVLKPHLGQEQDMLN